MVLRRVPRSSYAAFSASSYIGARQSNPSANEELMHLSSERIRLSFMGFSRYSSMAALMQVSTNSGSPRSSRGSPAGPMSSECCLRLEPNHVPLFSGTMPMHMRRSIRE